MSAAQERHDRCRESARGNPEIRASSRLGRGGVRQVASRKGDGQLKTLGVTGHETVKDLRNQGDTTRGCGTRAAPPEFRAVISRSALHRGHRGATEYQAAK